MAVSEIKNRQLVTRNFTSEATSVAVNTEATIAIPITAPSGYTAIGILDFNVDTRNFSAAGARMTSSTTVQIRGKNTSSNAISATGEVKILFAPT